MFQMIQNGDFKTFLYSSFFVPLIVQFHHHCGSSCTLVHVFEWIIRKLRTIQFPSLFLAIVEPKVSTTVRHTDFFPYIMRGIYIMFFFYIISYDFYISYNPMSQIFIYLILLFPKSF